MRSPCSSSSSPRRLLRAPGRRLRQPPADAAAAGGVLPADGTGPAWFVDGSRGNDAADGSELRPWKTVARAARALRPGDTLYLRAGIYREAVTLAVAGAVGRPITVRSYPGELVVIDRGIPELYDDPPARGSPPPAARAASSCRHRRSPKSRR